jgi:hypothetical protein
MCVVLWIISEKIGLLEKFLVLVPIFLKIFKFSSSAEEVILTQAYYI